jgi:opacity protein-like surface antigen
MKYVLAVVMLILAFAAVSVSQTDTSFESHKTPELLVWGGLSLPYLPEDYRMYWKSGLNVGAGAGFSLDPGSIGYGAFYLTAEYGRTNFDEQRYNDSLKVLHPSDTALGGPVKLMNFMLNFKASFSSTKHSFAPYFLLGVGYMYYTQAQIYVPTDTTLNVDGVNKGGIAWTFGVGIEFPLTDNARAFIQGKSLLGATTPSRQYFPITAGITYTL